MNPANKLPCFWKVSIFTFLSLALFINAWLSRTKSLSTFGLDCSNKVALLRSNPTRIMTMRMGIITQSLMDGSKCISSKWVSLGQTFCARFEILRVNDFITYLLSHYSKTAIYYSISSKLLPAPSLPQIAHGMHAIVVKRKIPATRVKEPTKFLWSGPISKTWGRRIGETAPAARPHATARPIPVDLYWVGKSSAYNVNAEVQEAA